MTVIDSMYIQVYKYIPYKLCIYGIYGCIYGIGTSLQAQMIGRRWVT